MNSENPYKKHIILLLILLISTTFTVGLNANIPEKPNSKIELKSPRDTFRVFRTAMRKAALRDYSNVWVAISCISPQGLRHIKGSMKSEIIFNNALKLYLVLKYLDYDLDEIPETISTNAINVLLSSENDGTSFSFSLIKNKSGNWQFSANNFSNPDFIELYKSKVQETKIFTSQNLAGDTFVKSMMSPAQSYSTFINGVEGNYGFTIEDAVKVLELTKIHPLLRPIIGKFYAIAIYRIIKNASSQSLSTLSDEPDYPLP